MQDRPTELLFVWINCKDRQEAEMLAETLIAERLAASANTLPAIASLFHWRGAVVSAEEVPLIVKTNGLSFEALQRRVSDLHSYETPCILGLSADRVNAAYAAWLQREIPAPKI
ncbi:MAG: divalent-cation tolerance protein CutA [Pseudomonadota bacterium]